MADFERVKSDALLGALAAVGFAIGQELARQAPDPDRAAERMQANALRLLADSAELLTPPADAIARRLVETVFLH